jgi:C_GCAxxG_C_C family probable redox protein
MLELSSTTEVRRAAEESLGTGLYCAESVLSVLAQAQGIESDLLPGLASGFCGGMAGTCGTCGALTGAVMGLGLALGRSDPSESLKSVYMATHRLVREFESEFGARDCDKLLGCDIGTPEGKAIFREKELSARCTQFTGRAAELAAQIIAELGG